MAVDDGVLQNRSCWGVDDGLVGTVVVATILEMPAVALLVEFETGVVVALVEVFEDRGEDFGLFIREIDTLVGGLVELAGTCGLEVRRVRQDILVCCKETLLGSDTYCDDGADETSVHVPKITKRHQCLPSIGR